MRLSCAEIRKLCLKPNEAAKPLYARVVTHALSTRLVWYLQDVPGVTANRLTLASLAAALAAVPFFCAMTPLSALAGALCIEIYYVLDAADGQWSRLKKTQTKTGAFFDSLVTYIVEPALFGSIGWGLYNQTGEVGYIALGALTGFAALWLSLLWHARAAIFLYHIQRTDRVTVKNRILPASAAAASGSGPARTAFIWLQRSVTFPYTMNALTLLCVIGFFAQNTGAMHFYLVFTFLAGAGAAVALTTVWIVRGKIDRDWSDVFDIQNP